MKYIKETYRNLIFHLIYELIKERHFNFKNFVGRIRNRIDMHKRYKYVIYRETDGHVACAETRKDDMIYYNDDVYEEIHKGYIRAEKIRKFKKTQRVLRDEKVIIKYLIFKSIFN